MNSQTSEKQFQKDIINHFTDTGYIERSSSNYDRVSCMDIELTLNFIKTTQAEQWEKFESIYKENAESKFFYRLVKEIESKGTIHVLRNGFKDVGAYFKLFYPRPNNNKNPELLENFTHNIFSVVDELEYEEDNGGNRLDLAIFINGLPIITIELKDTFSQGVEKAMKQYENDRDPKNKIFNRCFVHFAMSDEKIFMTTKLDKDKTRFLPFNKGIENPIVPDDYKTSYLYKDILQINKLSKLISNFIFEEEKKSEKVTDTDKIFPRYHQLECVNLLLDKVNLGTDYLIQHSAGSGKTKTIAWLAHGLLNKFDKQDERIYDMVIVISDRKVIDKQLQDQVKAIEKTKGIVEVIDKNSKQLAESLKSGSNIVVTTLQKFPHILEETRNMPNRKYAVIIDEAHSSQTGEFARSMKQVLGSNQSKESDEELDVEDEIIRELKAVKNLSNISFFAFTATPKNKTLEMFGTLNKLGEYHAFHEYTMKQAIEEGFILDVLANYLTYPSYFNLIKTIEDDPEFDENKAKRILRKFVEKHDYAISTKTGIILDHFMNSTKHKIKGHARAMLVTSSREQAVLYKKEFDKQIKENNYNIKPLVAFTGSLKHDMQEYTENSMNNLPKNESIVNAFKKNPYRILIVANKFQTGFDEPLLHTMYVDKSLNGITAVQTLSRVNRIYKNKNDTLILDFANKTETIQKAFQPYYESTYLKEATDPHKLYNLEDKLLDYHVFDGDDIDRFVTSYKKGASQPKLHNILNIVVQSFKQLTKEEQIAFKKDLRQYQSIYSFLSQLIPFEDVNLEKLFIFNKFLNKKLPRINNPLPFNVLEDVDMDSYKIIDNDKTSISLNSDGELNPLSDTVSLYVPEEKTKLSEIIKKLNDAFGTDFSDDNKVFLKQVKDNMLSNEDLASKIANNSKENVAAIFEKYFKNELFNLLESNIDLYKKISDNPEVREKLKIDLLDLVYDQKDKKLLPELKEKENKNETNNLSSKKDYEDINLKNDELIKKFKDYEKQIHDLKEKYKDKEDIARKKIKERFPPPQMTYDRFIGEIDKWNEIFINQSELALNMIDIDLINMASGHIEKVETELKKKVDILKSFIEKMESLAVELLLNIANSDETVDGEIEELLDEMKKVVDSVKEYK
jgi:type I restriction enzyme R subunit